MQLFKQFYLESFDTNRRGFIGSLVTGATALSKLLSAVASKLPPFFREGLNPKIPYIKVNIQFGTDPADEFYEIEDAPSLDTLAATMTPAQRDYHNIGPGTRPKGPNALNPTPRKNYLTHDGVEYWKPNSDWTSTIADGIEFNSRGIPEKGFSIYVDKSSPAAQLWSESRKRHGLALYDIDPTGVEYDKIYKKFQSQVYKTAFTNKEWVDNTLEELQGGKNIRSFWEKWEDDDSFFSQLPAGLDGHTEFDEVHSGLEWSEMDVDDVQKLIDDAVNMKQSMHSSIRMSKNDLDHWVGEYKMITGESKVPVSTDKLLKNWSDDIMEKYKDAIKLIDANIKFFNNITVGQDKRKKKEEEYTRREEKHKQAIKRLPVKFSPHHHTTIKHNPHATEGDYDDNRVRGIGEAYLRRTRLRVTPELI